MKKAVFFDLYGTLIDIKTDEYDPWVYSVLSQFLSYRTVKIAPDELRDTYFGEIKWHLQQSREEHPEVDVYKIFCEIMHRYGNKRYPKSIVIDTAMLFRSLTRRHFGLFPSVLDTLTSFGKKYIVAIISDAQWVFAEPEMKMLGLDRFFRLRILSSRFGFKKPDVRLFKIAMEKLRVRPEESVYIGDNPDKDLFGARGAGMKFILFSSDFQVYNNLKTDAFFNDYSELERVISEIL
jgi:putative hydrolase of the HAD superfamily